MSQSLSFGILGTGHMAQTMAHCLAGMDDMAVAGFASRDPVRARSVSSACGAIGTYGSLEDMLADSTVDAIYIANETAAHTAAAIQSLQAGKPVLCEKPCGLNAADAEAVAQVAAQTGTLFMEAVATPFLPAVAAAIEAGATGRLGEVHHLSAQFGYPTSPTSHPGCYSEKGGGVLLDRAIYPVMLALIALGPVANVKASVRRNSAGLDVEASLMLDHANGAVSILAASLLTELDNRMTLAGTQGTATVDAPLLAAERYSVTVHGAVDRAPPGNAGFTARLKQSPLLRRVRAVARNARMPQLSYGHGQYRPQIMHFRDLILAGERESPVLPPAHSVEALRILDQARAATS